MAKRKYYYVIVNKENANLLVDNGRLPVFWLKRIAKGTLKFYDRKKYMVAKMPIVEFEKLILTTHQK